MATLIESFTLRTSLAWGFILPAAVGQNTNSNSFQPGVDAFKQGTSVGEVDKVYHYEGAIAAGANLDLDLSGSLLGLLGSATVFTKIKMIWVELLTTTLASGITFAGAVTNSCIAWAIPVRNGGRVVWVDRSTNNGIAVTAGTADIVRITNLDGALAANVRLCIAGN